MSQADRRWDGGGKRRSGEGFTSNGRKQARISALYLSNALVSPAPLALQAGRGAGVILSPRRGTGGVAWRCGTWYGAA